MLLLFWQCAKCSTALRRDALIKRSPHKTMQVPRRDGISRREWKRKEVKDPPRARARASEKKASRPAFVLSRGSDLLAGLRACGKWRERSADGEGKRMRRDEQHRREKWRRGGGDKRDQKAVTYVRTYVRTGESSACPPFATSRRALWESPSARLQTLLRATRYEIIYFVPVVG